MLHIAASDTHTTMKEKKKLVVGYPLCVLLEKINGSFAPL